MRLGSHVGIGGGFDKTIAQARALGCECIQIFAGNPRSFRVGPYDADAWRAFRLARSEAGISPAVIHTS
ncbi:MAG: hypothetical protein GIW99_10515 [Candidatus Eremiobacteraeota bacterium]|nr:hypothetical protein [Candidatus Eremiobacteraeota bacterium]MBC5828094.1 hypothetical protein [Candidatus Eremiobacteraeota bacterium]